MENTNNLQNEIPVVYLAGPEKKYGKDWRNNAKKAIETIYSVNTVSPIESLLESDNTKTMENIAGSKGAVMVWLPKGVSSNYIKSSELQNLIAKYDPKKKNLSLVFGSDDDSKEVLDLFSQLKTKGIVGYNNNINSSLEATCSEAVRKAYLRNYHHM